MLAHDEPYHTALVPGADDRGHSEPELQRVATSADPLIFHMAQQALLQVFPEDDAGPYPVLKSSALAKRRDLDPRAVERTLARHMHAWINPPPGGNEVEAVLRADAAEEEGLWLRGCSTEEVYCHLGDELMDLLISDTARCLLEIDGGGE